MEAAVGETDDVPEVPDAPEDSALPGPVEYADDASESLSSSSDSDSQSDSDGEREFEGVQETSRFRRALGTGSDDRFSQHTVTGTVHRLREGSDEIHACSRRVTLNHARIPGLPYDPDMHGKFAFCVDCFGKGFVPPQ